MWEDTNEGGARSAAGGRHCPHMSSPHGGQHGVRQQARCTRKIDVFRCNFYNCEQHSVRSRVSGPGTTIKCREGGEGGHNARNSESA